MRPFTSFGFLSFPFLFRGAAAPPGGCGGNLGIMDVKSPNFNQLVWTCANINPSSLFQSGQNSLIASYQTTDDQACANLCATWVGKALLMAGIRNYESDTCECWEIGDIQTWGLLPAASASTNSTFIDFYELGVATPPSAQDWGILTCPQGSWGVAILYEWGQPGIGSCSSLTIIPAHPPLGNLGLTGAGMCRVFWKNAEYAISDDYGYITCYDDLAGAKYHFNYSSTNTLWDLVDFLLPPSTTTSSTTMLGTEMTNLITSTKSSSKSSIKSTSSTKTTSRPTTTHTSTQKSSVNTTSVPNSTSKQKPTSTKKLTTTKYTSSASPKSFKSSTKST